MRSRFVIALALVAAVVLSGAAILSVPAGAADELTQSDVDAALAKRRQASAALEGMTARFEQAMADEEILRDRIHDLAISVSRLEQDIGVRRTQVRELVKQRYMSGGSLGTDRFFSARTFSDLPLQTEYSGLMNARDVATLRGLEVAEQQHVEQQALLDQSLDGQQVLVSELTTLAADLGSALADADADYLATARAFQVQEEERLKREEEERQRRLEAEQRAREAAAATSTTTPAATTTTSGSPATTSAPSTTAPTTTAAPTTTQGTTTTVPPTPPPVVTDGKTCPVNAAVSFSDTWGAARSGGRTHKGVDMVAARNAPIVAIEGGTVTRTSNSSLGGLSVYLTGESGSKYYYAHLEYIEGGITGGTRVGVGDLLGGNGSTGNAPDWLPHLHFQFAPPGDDWVNPYPLVKALCG